MENTIEQDKGHWCRRQVHFENSGKAHRFNGTQKKNTSSLGKFVKRPAGYFILNPPNKQESENNPKGKTTEEQRKEQKMIPIHFRQVTR